METEWDWAPYQTYSDDPRSFGPVYPTPLHNVFPVIEIARITGKDVIYDLGCGNGEMLESIVRNVPGSRGVGYEIDEKAIELASNNFRASSAFDRLELRNEDITNADLSDATIIYIWLLPWALNALESKLESQIKNGTRVVCYLYTCEGSCRKYLKRSGYNYSVYSL